jgi:hypothetical protein
MFWDQIKKQTNKTKQSKTKQNKKSTQSQQAIEKSKVFYKYCHKERTQIKV